MSTSMVGAPRIRNNVRLTLTRRGRVVAVVLAILALAALVCAVFFFASPSVAASESAQGAFSTVTVDEGDNLWSLAQQNLPAGTDLRDYILLVQEVNGLDTTVIQPGQSIAFPQD